MASSFSASVLASCGEVVGELLVLGLLGEFLRPVHGEVELAAAVVELAGLARRALVVLQQLADRGVQRLAQQRGPLVAGLVAQVLEAGAQREELAERIPAQVVLLDQLVHVLGRRPARARLVHSAAGHQRHDRQHLGAGAQLQDREQVGEVVAQDVSGRGDGVLPADHPLQRVPHGPHLRHDLDVQALGVVVRRGRP